MRKNSTLMLRLMSTGINLLSTCSSRLARPAGGTLATLCAVDLLLSSRVVNEHSEHVNCVTFGASRSFNLSFKRMVDELRSQGRLRALR